MLMRSRVLNAIRGNLRTTTLRTYGRLRMGSVWILLSSLTIYVLGKDIISSLRVTSTSISSPSSRTPGASSHEAKLKLNSETASQAQSQSWVGASSGAGGGGAGKTLKVH